MTSSFPPDARFTEPTPQGSFEPGATPAYPGSPEQGERTTPQPGTYQPYPGYQPYAPYQAAPGYAPQPPVRRSRVAPWILGVVALALVLAGVGDRFRRDREQRWLYRDE